jgi:hypothetical protein
LPLAAYPNWNSGRATSSAICPPMVPFGSKLLVLGTHRAD